MFRGKEYRELLQLVIGSALHCGFSGTLIFEKADERKTDFAKMLLLVIASSDA